MNKRYIIIPGCCDLNRGDQALGWETCRIAKEAGFVGDYSILAERGEPIAQSEQEGYEVLTPILEHPSRKYNDKDNIVYDKITKIRWGWVALKDFLYSIVLLVSPLRLFFKKFLKDEIVLHTIRRFEEADAIFMKGGGLIQSHGGLLSTYATYYRLYHIFLAEALHKPVYIMPNSFGPFKGPGVKWMVRKALKRCKVVTTRERKSQEVVKSELGLDIPLYPDLAFYLESKGLTKSEFKDKIILTADKKIVALTMRPYRFPNSKNPEMEYEKFKNEIRRFIEWLYSENYMPLIIEHTFAITSHENDGECIKDVIAGIDRSKFMVFSDRSMNCTQLKAVYGCCDYIIGTRFHSMIFSLSNMVPGIAISYDGYKSIGIMKDMGLAEYVIDISDVTVEKLIQSFNSVKNNEELIKQKISSYIDKANIERNNLIDLMRTQENM